MAILSLIARLGLDGTGFQQGLRKAEGMGARFAGSLKSQLAGAFSAAAVMQFARSVVEHVNRIKDLSEQYQVTTDEVQRLDFAAKQSGMTFEEVGAALIKLGAARQDAAEGNEELRTKFARFGVSLADLNDAGKRNVDLLRQIADAMKSMEVSPRVQSDFRDLAGRTAPKLLQVLTDLQAIRFDPIPQDKIERIEEATQKLENFLTKAKGIAAIKAADFMTGIENADPKLVAKNLFSKEGLRRLTVNPISWLIGGVVGSGTKQAEEKRTTEAARNFALGIGQFFLNNRLPGSPTPLFDEKQKAETMKRAAAASGFKAMDADSLARIGGFTGPTAKQDTITPEVRRIVTMLQRGLKIQDL